MNNSFRHAQQKPVICGYAKLSNLQIAAQRHVLHLGANHLSRTFHAQRLADALGRNSIAHPILLVLRVIICE
jgi:hypothetical protein